LEEKFTHLGKTEWAIMNICWRLKTANAKVIFDESQKDANRSYLTVRTILDRLVAKNYLTREQNNSLYFYSPAIKEEKLKWSAVKDFAYTVFENSICPVFIYAVKNKKISKEELSNLKKLIENIDDND
jgi:BlaI family transcriptional regulator, penicillinase repressor